MGFISFNFAGHRYPHDGYIGSTQRRKEAKTQRPLLFVRSSLRLCAFAPLR
jgi:hypothetical protein